MWLAHVSFYYAITFLFMLLVFVIEKVGIVFRVKVFVVLSQRSSPVGEKCWCQNVSLPLY